MKRFVIVLLFVGATLSGLSQEVEWIDRQENFQTGLGQTLKIPLRIKNTSDKAQLFVIRKVQGDLGSNQKGYFCLGDDCMDPSFDQLTRRLEPGETLSNLYYAVEAGLVTTFCSIRFEAFPRGNPNLGFEHGISISVDEKPAKSLVFQSRDISIHDVYPNPVVDLAYLDYKLYNESLKAKVVIHNILGSPVGSYELLAMENRVKIQADEFTSGVYFYTLYLDNVGVVTRKMVVRK